MTLYKVEQASGKTTFHCMRGLKGAHGKDGYIKTESASCLYSRNQIEIDGEIYNRRSLINFLREDCKNKGIDSKIKKGFFGFGGTSNDKIRARFRENMGKDVRWDYSGK